MKGRPHFRHVAEVMLTSAERVPGTGLAAAMQDLRYQRHHHLLCPRHEPPSGYTTAEERDEFPPPHGACPKAKDHELIIAPCVAAKSGH